MYVLSRKLGETVVIGRNIVVTVVEFDPENDLIRLGVRAPQYMRIAKLEEVLEDRGPQPLD